MSNVGNGENDFEGLEDLNLPEDVVNRIKQARMFAREAINKLEPRHILGWNHLRVILADVLMNLDAEIKLLEMIKKSEE